MTDPFFTTWNSTWSNEWTENQSNVQWNPADNTQNSIGKIMSQQEQIQWKYKELKELLENPELTDNQKEEIHDQMQKLSDLYSHNKATIATLTTNISGEKEIHVDKNVNTNDSKSKNFSFKKFMIWCGILLFLFLGWLVAIFYSLISNPNRLENFWIDGCTAVNLLQIFSIMFFGLLFVWWLWLFLVNLNKSIVSKNKRKAPFLIWTILSFLLMVIVAILLVTMLQKLSWLSETCGDLWSKQIVKSYAVVKNNKFKTTKILTSENPKLVAPINISFTFNSTAYKSNVAAKLWSVNVKEIVLTCWNWDSIKLSENNVDFENTCFYTQKWTYQPELFVNYIDSVWTEKTYPVSVDPVNIGSEVVVASDKAEVQALNSALLVWKNPVTLKFDSASVFKDYNLPYYIKRSSECNWNWDDEVAVEFQNKYLNEWIYDVCVYFPELWENVFTFPIRVEQWEVSSDFDVKYTISLSTSNNSYNNPEMVQITQLPTTLTLQILSVSPDNPSTQKKLFIDWEQVPSQFSDPNTFKVTIDEDKDQEITLELSDVERQINTKKTIKVSINQATIIWALLVSPETVWTSPFTVNMDASTTTLNDPNDEIVYFSRDFGDWIKNSNTSEAIISHTYEYDFINENGVFYPSVVMRTKNWLTFTVTWTIISVKKPNTNISISLDEHPAQLANVWENVPMSISFDWMPKKIYWEFGDWDTQECDGRSCSDTMHTYIKWWTYSIKARVEFDDKPALEWYINLQVR